MILAKYKLDIISNIITRFPIIIGLIIVLIVVLLIGIYTEIRGLKRLMRANNAILMEMTKSKKDDSYSASKE